jgi:hypothetical protein
MTKQEKIREAYGEHFETVKDYVDENGWCNAYFSGAGLFQHDVIFKKGLIEKWRPKSLAGIEDNNGWIKIESDNFPKLANKMSEIENYFVLTNENEIQIAPNINFWYWRIHYTHYQPIFKPKKPIY